MTRQPLLCTIVIAWTVVVTSCIKPGKKDLPEEVSEPPLALVGQPKILTTQGSQPGDNVNSSIQDKAGNLWFGTTSEGV
jgi:hypothetical protein